MIIMQDNIGTVAIANNPTFHKKTKHIDLKYHWVQEKVQAGRFKVELCHNEDQAAGVLTKALPHPKHQCHKKEMGLSTV